MNNIPDFKAQMLQYIDLHNHVRDNMKKLKHDKEQKKHLENMLLKVFELHDLTSLDVNKEIRIYRFKNPDRLTIYHPRNLLDV